MSAVAPAPAFAQSAPTSADIAAKAPRAPDYALPASWAAGRNGGGASTAFPDGASPTTRRAAVDVFFVHPTTSRSQSLWNEDPRDTAANGWVDASSIARQASVFNGCCRIFAPRYRAATYKVFASPAAQEAAFALAYTDVERAFDWYLAHKNHGRPFIIAGHSQGAFHIATLLERKIAGTVLQRRMVGAWIIGINLSEGELGRRFKDVGLCRTAAQTGCVLQWNSILAGSDLGPATQRAEQAYVAKYGDRPDKTIACVNPLTFDQRKLSARAVASLGAVPGAPGFGPLKPLKPGTVAAHCENGWLVVELDPALGLAPLPGGSMHYHDYGLFYADIRANAKLRVQAYLSKHRARR